VVDATALAAGDSHTCALILGGTLSCWGDNFSGQLGNGTFVDANVAGTVVGLTGVTSVVAGSAFTCVNRTTGVAACWGDNLFGQIGNGATLPPPPNPGDPPPPDLRVNLPEDVVGLTGVTAIGAGSDHACATTGGVLLSCWGRNDSGQLGDGTTSTSSLARTTTVIGASQVAGGEGHTCALKPNGSAQCSGSNARGQLGNNTTSNSTTPVTVVAL
jgi:alpha-tubulin suppressor-like RCC1 family protein